MRTRRSSRRFLPALGLLPDRIAPSDLAPADVAPADPADTDPADTDLLPPPSDPGLCVPPVITIPPCDPNDDGSTPDIPPDPPSDTATTSDIVGADNYAFWMYLGPV